MDQSLIDNAYWVIFASIVGFLVLAFILLYPVYRFINRETEDSERWTPEEIARRQQRRGDGSASGTPEIRPPSERSN